MNFLHIIKNKDLTFCNLQKREGDSRFEWTGDFSYFSEVLRKPTIDPSQLSCCEVCRKAAGIEKPATSESVSGA